MIIFTTTGPWEIECPPKKFKNPFAVAMMRKGSIANAIMRHKSWPRMILMYFGSKQVTSAAKGVMLQAIEVPSVAKVKDAEAKKTPARDLDV